MKLNERNQVVDISLRMTNQYGNRENKNKFSLYILIISVNYYIVLNRYKEIKKDQTVILNLENILAMVLETCVESSVSKM